MGARLNAPFSPGALLAARLLVIYPFLSGVLGMIRLRPGVGAVPVIDRLDGVPDVLWMAIVAVYGIMVVALWLDRGARAAAIIAGSIVLLDVVVALEEYSNNRLLVGLALVLLGLADERMGTWPIRAQLSLMYAGAALNKLLEADWRSGRFVENWTIEVLDLSVYPELADRWPDLHQVLAWLTIGVESGLAALVLVVQRTRWAVIAALGFHGGMLVLTEGTVSWLFGYAVAATLISLTEPRRTSPYVIAAIAFWGLQRVVA